MYKPAYTDSFVHKKNTKPSCFDCMNSTPKVPSPKETPFFGKQAVMFFNFVIKRKETRAEQWKKNEKTVGFPCLILHTLSSFPPPPSQLKQLAGAVLLCRWTRSGTHTVIYAWHTHISSFISRAS